MDIDQELIDHLVEKFGEEEAFEKIEAAKGVGELEQYLEESPPETNGSTTYGWSVVECRYMASVYDKESDEFVDKEQFTGYCLKFTGPTVIRYCGRAMAETRHLKGVSDPWPNTKEGKASVLEACQHKASLFERPSMRALRRVQLPLLVTTMCDRGQTPKSISKKLTQRQQDALTNLTEAHRQAASGIKTDTEAVASLLDQVADVLGLPK